MNKIDLLNINKILKFFNIQEYDKYYSISMN